MSTTIKGAFKNIDNDDIYVEIVSSKGLSTFNIGEGDIKFAKDPITIEVNCDEMTQHIIKKKCKVSLITSVFLGDYLFTGNDRDVTIDIYKNSICMFSGYVQHQSFSQAWANDKEKFDLNCVDYLSTLSKHYLTDMSNYDTLKSQNNIKSFKDYMSIILPTYTYWDRSKNIEGDTNVFDICGVSMNAFLGEDKDDVKSNEDILEAILRYLNLHIVQEGHYLMIYDWYTIGSGITRWYNIYDNSEIDLTSNTLTINVSSYASNDTNVSMNDIYNRISVKAAFEKKEDIGTSPLDSKDIKYYNNYKQMWYSEIVSEGEGSSAHDGFREAVKQTYNHYNTIDYSDYKGWSREDWYMKWAYNPNWKLYYKKKPIEDWLEFDVSGNVVNQHRIMQALKQNRFMPAMVSVGPNKKKLTYNNKNRLSASGGVSGEISMTDYLVVSVNGNLDDSSAEFSRINSAIKEACGATSDYYKDSYGLFVYTGDSGMFSPADNETTNYLIFSGSIILNCVYQQSGWLNLFGGGTYTKPNCPDIKFKEAYDNVGAYQMTVDISQNDDGALYSQQFYTCYDPASSQEVLVPNQLMLYPFVKDDKRQELAYNYSGHWDSEDKIDKLAIFICQLKIGDKYLVETYEGGNKQKPRYHWYTLEQCPTINGVKNTTFTLGIDPEIDSYIVGKEYEISNTVDGRYSNEKGMAIPIKRSDALSGAVEFKILSVDNSIFNEITRRHPTMFRSTKYYDNYKNILSHVSSIWVKGFDIKIVSDNKGYDVDSNNTDLVYYSDENRNSISEMDDIEFTINTQPSTDVLLAHGISTNISNTNVVNMKTNVSVQELTEHWTGEHDIAEKLYINQYYQFYSEPKAIVESTLKLNDSNPLLKMHKFSEFGDTIPMSYKMNLKYNTYKVRAIQI